MSAWIDIVKHEPASLEAHASWKDFFRTSIKTVLVSLIAMAISTVVMVIKEHRWQYNSISAGSMGMWELCLAFVGSGVAVTGAEWVFGGSDETEGSSG